MIIVKKPFIYLRDYLDWTYSNFGNKIVERKFMDPARIMLLERRGEMICQTFKEKSGKTSPDAEYIVIHLLDFLNHSTVKNDVLHCQYSPKSRWGFCFIRLGLKVIRDPEIVIPIKEAFPLIIRNEKYNFYVAPRDVEESKQ